MIDTGQNHARALDAADMLAPLRARFAMPEGRVYLDGNSLGALPAGTDAAIADVVARQWGADLITSWTAHGWIGLPQQLGDRIAAMIGADPGEVLVCDSTSVNLFKLIAAGLMARPGRTKLLSESGNFPTDLYMAEGAVGLLDGRQLCCVDPDDIIASIDEDTALLVLTHVHYTSGRRHDMERLTAAAHAKGALVLWDLSHSTGAVPVDLNGSGADFAVGCGYKYLNGGPGAPAYLFVAKRLQSQVHSPLSGWMGHAAPFGFEASYRPAPGLARFLCGTPPVVAMAALAAGIGTLEGVDHTALFAKGGALGDYFIALMEARCGSWGFALASPRDAAVRGSHVSFAHPNAWPICRALIARNVIGDFRSPDKFRAGFAPLYTRFVDVWQAVDTLHDILASRAWDQPRYHEQADVT